MNTNQIAFQNETKVLQQAVLLGREIAALETELEENQPLLNQLRLLSKNLQSSREFLLSKDHPIAFIGSIGVGKTTAICGVLGLVDGKGGTALSTSSGRTTLDAQLQRLAKNHGCVYTRYADDLTFSRRKGAFPKELATEDMFDDITVGKELRAIIEQNGFQIHPDKVHLYRNTHRQTVTGLTVNSRVNVPRKYIREIRAIICDWRKNGLKAAEEAHHKHFYRRPTKLGGKPPLPRILEGKLNFLKMVRGLDDQVRRNLQRQLVNVWPNYLAVMEKENKELNMRDLFISHASEDKKDFVRPLVDALIREGISVWYDEFEITIGDTLVNKINDGLIKSRYGLVVLSPNFFNVKKTWPNHEIAALFAQEDADMRPRVLPIWHNVDQHAVAAKNPLLAGKAAWKSADHAPEKLASMFRDFMKTRRK